MKVIETKNYKKLRKKAMDFDNPPNAYDFDNLPDAYKSKIFTELAQLVEEKSGQRLPELLKAGLDLQHRGRIDPKTCDEASDGIERVLNFNNGIGAGILENHIVDALINLHSYLLRLAENPELSDNDGLEEQWKLYDDGLEEQWS